jgi:hypothetical protein
MSDCSHRPVRQPDGFTCADCGADLGWTPLSPRRIVIDPTDKTDVRRLAAALGHCMQHEGTTADARAVLAALAESSGP